MSSAVSRDQSEEFVSVVIGVPRMMLDNSRRGSESPVTIRYWRGHWGSEIDIHDSANVLPLFGFSAGVEVGQLPPLLR